MAVVTRKYGEVSVDIGLNEVLADNAEIAMFRLAEYTDALIVPLTQARAVAQEDMQVRFEDTKTDPRDEPWADLDPDYQDSKEAAGYDVPNILIRTGDLHAAATSDAAFFILDDTLFFNTDILPRKEDGVSYGLLHQTGTGDPGNWGLAHSHRGSVRAGVYEKHEKQSAHMSLDIGRGSALPRRAFIGLSDYAALSIDRIFDKWFEDAGAIFQGGAGGGRSTLGFGSNVRGSFPIMSFTKRGQPILRTPAGPRFGRMH